MAGTTASVISQQKAQSAERHRDELQNQRQKLETVKAARAAYATAQNNAANQGVLNSSGAQGGEGSIQSQLGSNLTFLDKYNALSTKASNAYGQASVFGSVAQFGKDVFAQSDKIATIFG